MISQTDSSADRLAIDVRALRKTYRERLIGGRRTEALKGVNFQVRPGEIFGLLGPNGAGKTTLIKVLLGVVRRTAGDAYMLGWPAGDRRGRIKVGYLPENHRIPRHHTGNSALAYYGGLSGLSRSEIRRRSPQMLDMVGLTKWGKASVREYSKGMQQRLGLAQAMLHFPELLILDEPTDGVDPVGRSEMRVILQQLKEAGKTIFLNSHLLQEVELVCDRVAIMDRGLLLREGPISEITERPTEEVQFVLIGDEGTIRGALAQFTLLRFLPAGHGQFQATVRVENQSIADQCVDVLRHASVSIGSMSRNKQTLEQAFLEIIGATATAAHRNK